MTNTTKSGVAPIDIKFSAMSLSWSNPKGEAFVPWLREVKSAGYDGITSFGHNGLEDFVPRPAELRRLLDDQGLALAAVDVMLQADVDAYVPMFELMQAAGCRILVCIIRVPEKNYALYADWVNRVGSRSGAYGIRTHLHNNTRSIGENLTDWSNLAPLLDPACASLMLDTGHATKDFHEVPARQRALSFLQRYWDRLDYMEFKDWNTTTDLDTPLGEGETDYPGIFALMKQRGYRGWITVEQNNDHGLSLGRSPTICARISREFLRTHLGT